MKQDENIVN